MNVPSHIAPLAFLFADDGAVPNNPHFPMLVYRRGVDLSRGRDPETLIEGIFRGNGWGHGQWRDGIFPFVHYHSMIHEALGIARGRATVRFGGEKGEVLDIEPGDIAVLPAGTGHQCLNASGDHVVIGAYPKDGRYDLCRGKPEEHRRALATIPEVPRPDCDPLHGKDGPLLTLWRA
jgi:uncharacterized protein YjlB